MCTIEDTWPWSSWRPGYSSTSTEALALSWLRTNAEAFGSARCTRAAFTGCRVLTVRASSVSRASWKRAFSMNWLVPRPWSCWIISKPWAEPLGRPCEASFMRAS